MIGPRGNYLRRMVTLEPEFLLQKHFGIVNIDKTREFTVHMNLVKSNELEVSFTYKKTFPFIDFKVLPIEISDIVHSYTSGYICIKANILYTSEYPFKQPIWKLINVDHNVQSNINLTEYYEYLIKKHNDQYLIDWSPAINFV
jgi:hypothetical protein